MVNIQPLLIALSSRKSHEGRRVNLQNKHQGYLCYRLKIRDFSVIYPIKNIASNGRTKACE